MGISLLTYGSPLLWSYSGRQIKSKIKNKIRFPSMVDTKVESFHTGSFVIPVSFVVISFDTYCINTLNNSIVNAYFQISLEAVCFKIYLRALWFIVFVDLLCILLCEEHRKHNILLLSFLGMFLVPEWCHKMY